MNIEYFLKTKYLKGGRGEGGLYDCWGLVNDARECLFDKQRLPELLDTTPGKLGGITKAVRSVSALHGFVPCQPKAGAIATAWFGKLCTHVGLVVVVDSMLFILETDDPYGPAITPLHTFARRYTQVIYYDN